MKEASQELLLLLGKRQLGPLCRFCHSFREAVENGGYKPSVGARLNGYAFLGCHVLVAWLRACFFTFLCTRTSTCEFCLLAGDFASISIVLEMLLISLSLTLSQYHLFTSIFLFLFTFKSPSLDILTSPSPFHPSFRCMALCITSITGTPSTWRCWWTPGPSIRQLLSGLKYRR